jgi:hypothetical protein
MTHSKSDSSAKYMSVFFHVYHIEKILASIKEVEHFDNASINAHVNLFFFYLILISYFECFRMQLILLVIMLL